MKNYIFIIVLLLLTGCEGWQWTHYYATYYNGELLKAERRSDNHPLLTIKRGEYIKKANEGYKEYCTYYLSYFLPINFWNFRFTEKQDIRKAIKDLNKDGIIGSNMRDIYYQSSGVGTPIFSVSCSKIIGEVYE